MPIAVSKIEELAPDQAALAAAAKLKKSGPWSLLGSDDAGTIWGECQGSGASPYRVVCSEMDYGTKCTCPSRKFPCKHALALLWMRADGAHRFDPAPAPDWVTDWLGRRRKSAAAPRQAQSDKVSASAAQAQTIEPAVEDPKAAARATAQRERNRAEREASIRAGLDELDIWIADALQAGLASFMPAAGERCRKIVRRLVDAKAPGLAALVERLPADVFSAPEPSRTDRLIERLAVLHLIAAAYRNQDRLPDAAKSDIRHVVGWPITREALLADAQALRVRDRWMVVNTVVEVQADKLRRLETWLWRLGEGPAPRFAVLIDFVPVSLGKSGIAHALGEIFEAELVFFPSAVPLRAVIAQQTGAPTRGAPWPRPSDDLTGAVARLNAMLAARPWSSDLPFAAQGARVVASGKALWLTDTAGAISLPIRHDEDDLALPLVGLDDIDVFGCWNGHSLALGLCETPLGRWTAS